MTEWGCSTSSQGLIRQINEEFKLKKGRSPSLALQLDCSPETHKELQMKLFKHTLSKRKRRLKRKFGVRCFAQGRCSNHSEMFSAIRQHNNYHRKFFLNLCLLPNHCRGVRYPLAISFGSHQHLYASGGVSLLSLAEKQVASSSQGWHMETKYISHWHSNLHCDQVFQLFSVHPQGTHAYPNLVGESTYFCCEVTQQTTVGTAMTKLHPNYESDCGTDCTTLIWRSSFTSI